MTNNYSRKPIYSSVYSIDSRRSFRGVIIFFRTHPSNSKDTRILSVLALPSSSPYLPGQLTKFLSVTDKSTIQQNHSKNRQKCSQKIKPKQSIPNREHPPSVNSSNVKADNATENQPPLRHMRGESALSSILAEQSNSTSSQPQKAPLSANNSSNEPSQSQHSPCVLCKVHHFKFQVLELKSSLLVIHRFKPPASISPKALQHSSQSSFFFCTSSNSSYSADFNSSRVMVATSTATLALIRSYSPVIVSCYPLLTLFATKSFLLTTQRKVGHAGDFGGLRRDFAKIQTRGRISYQNRSVIRSTFAPPFFC
jgi:hypothetical protein